MSRQVDKKIDNLGYKFAEVLKITELEQGDFAMECKISPGTLSKALERSSLSKDIVDKIYDRFGVRKAYWQDGKEPIIIKKHASVQNEPAVKEYESWEAAAFRKIIEGDAQYVLVHKAAFENHRFTSVEQIEAHTKELAEARADVQRLVREFIEYVKDTRGLGSLPELPKVQEAKKDTAV